MLDLSDPAQARIDARLRQETAAYFTTVRPDGRPHTVPVWFLWDGATILIFSQPGDVKVRNLRQNPGVTLALDNFGASSQPVVVEGTAALVDAAAIAAMLPAYTTKYAALAAKIGLPPDALEKVYSQPVHLTPTRIRQDR
ncbi:MAG TPA: pyridoxamine 5'-phosphate oxidase family protein [Ktedonobacterales bacterium]|nr:pyridoxamine 5'-phosphate oxidase family protein [Ktedonobacterales bacterium]